MGSKQSEDAADAERDLADLREIARHRDAARERHAKLTDEQCAERKKLHWMCCPKCGSDLSEVQFRQVKVDKCFACGGAFLDDGELEQLTGKTGWFESMLRFFGGV